MWSKFLERDRLGFTFMTNDVSTERRVEVSVSKIVAVMHEVKAAGGLGFVAGSVVVHSIGVGNMLPSHVRVVCVDINQTVVAKPSDTGSSQAVGIVTDVGFFTSAINSASGD